MWDVLARGERDVTCTVRLNKTRTAGQVLEPPLGRVEQGELLQRRPKRQRRRDGSKQRPSSLRAPVRSPILEDDSIGRRPETPIVRTKAFVPAGDGTKANYNVVLFRLAPPSPARKLRLEDRTLDVTRRAHVNPRATPGVVAYAAIPVPSKDKRVDSS